jgi:hypothetical protein
MVLADLPFIGVNRYYWRKLKEEQKSEGANQWRGHILRFKDVDPQELLPEEVVLRKGPDNPFLGPGDRAEAYRTLYIAATRMQPLFEREKVRPSFIINTSRGKGLLWRWWPDQVGVVLFTKATNGIDVTLESRVCFLDLTEQGHVSLDLTKIVLNPPISEKRIERS